MLEPIGVVKVERAAEVGLVMSAAQVTLIPGLLVAGLVLDRSSERLIVGLLPEGEPAYPLDYVTDKPEAFMIAEIVREQVLKG